MYIREEPRQEPCPPGASILVKKINNKYDTTQCKMISCLLKYVYFFIFQIYFNWTDCSASGFLACGPLSGYAWLSQIIDVCRAQALAL